ncbi:mechanosensitive ion channel family protein [Sneathiella sp. HT1-7]|uniref:mechanosensitive ion channel family protein n=1 Tax=Sneathiella sp. HT1-7 TaxID=2887192 RepID=UPI001D14CE8A|nr:mechanosensitive ion channel domain-containing protein [Sneathiella sp. HT1-7]MCC3303338.1 mechanosensitive ion channel [Sneathiella sp. HT1-7]
MDTEKIREFFEQSLAHLTALASDVNILSQLLAVVGGLVFAYFTRRRLQLGFLGLRGRFPDGSPLTKIFEILATLSLPLIWLAIEFAILAIFQGVGPPSHIISAICSLLVAWIVINVVTSLAENKIWARLVAFCAWTIAALNILGLLTPTLVFLEDLAFNLGETRISMLGVAKALVAGIIVFWVTFGLSRFLEARIHKSTALTPSVQVLTAKLVRVGLISAAVLIILSNSGINITAFAVFSGALGVGIGFGLQKIVSNLISGIILLLDRSIKPGDVIEVGQTYGRVNTMGARYASVITRDAMEFLIPNEDLITQQVINWSYSSKNVRLRAPIGVSYDTDIPKALELIVGAAAEVPRVLSNPAPKCLMRGFGDSAIDLELRFWIADPEDGCRNVTSEVLVSVWKLFKKEGINVPFPQRDIRVEMVPPGSPVLSANEDEA